MKNPRQEMLEKVKQELSEFMNMLDEKEQSKYKVSKSSILFNYIVHENPNPAAIELFARILFGDKNETYSEILERL